MGNRLEYRLRTVNLFRSVLAMGFKTFVSQRSPAVFSLGAFATH
jgi:hypothetical protein